MEITPGTVAAERDRLRRRADVVVPLINETRAALGDLFGVTVDPVGADAYRREVDAVFADGEVAVNVAGYAGLLRRLDVAGDYPGFVVDEALGRELAATIAGGQPLALLAQATFHFADVHTHGVAATDGSGEAGSVNGAEAADRAGDGDAPARREGGPAGADDLDAALAAGFQTRLPGWDWREGPSPFAVEPGSGSASGPDSG